jgi:phage baseplate assembly protein W
VSEQKWPDVQIPAKAVSDKDDVRQPVRDLLEDLNLLGTRRAEADANKVTAPFRTTPDSIAVIESGATAATKWWAAGLGAIVIATWAKVAAWWGTQPPDLKQAVVFGAAIVTAAAALAISYLLSSDVRGRAAASVATFEARSRVAVEMIQAAQAVRDKRTTASEGQFIEGQLIALSEGAKVRNTAEPAANEKDWRAIAFERQADGTFKFLVVKREDQQLLDGSKVVFD